MIIVPELETVILLTPRTGSGSLRRAIEAAYPKSMMIYRHMEADGVPAGYDRWRKFGLVRDPVDRLWSLYKFMGSFSGPNGIPDQGDAYINAMRRSVERPFSEWIVENETVFTSPYDAAGLGRFYPNYTVRHSLPENCKSQFVYLRPDLGTEVCLFDDLATIAERLGVELGHHNKTAERATPRLDPAAADHISRFFAWDIATVARLRSEQMAA